MKCSLGISNFLEEISHLSHSIVFSEENNRILSLCGPISFLMGGLRTTLPGFCFCLCYAPMLILGKSLNLCISLSVWVKWGSLHWLQCSGLDEVNKHSALSTVIIMCNSLHTCLTSLSTLPRQLGRILIDSAPCHPCSVPGPAQTYTLKWKTQGRDSNLMVVAKADVTANSSCHCGSGWLPLWEPDIWALFRWQGQLNCLTGPPKAPLTCHFFRNPSDANWWLSVELPTSLEPRLFM